jgi:glutathione S-transferase
MSGSPDDRLILHHYPASPFSEKARLMLGFKGLAWASVLIPIVMPKPDVVALTGGHRRTPFLQVGADIYCDTALIARVLDARAPQPPLFPPTAPFAAALMQWADGTLFWTVMAYVMQPAGAKALFAKAPPGAAQAFRDDRMAMTAGVPWRTVADATAELNGYLRGIDAALTNGRPFLLGRDASIADFGVAHCLWFVRRAPPVAVILDGHRALSVWLDRVLAFGHSTNERMSSAAAVELARATAHHAATVVEPDMGFEPGQPVTVNAIDYARDTVTGELVGLTDDEVVVRRHDERAGTLHVHFPRAGFKVKPQETEP